MRLWVWRPTVTHHPLDDEDTSWNVGPVPPTYDRPFKSKFGPFRRPKNKDDNFLPRPLAASTMSGKPLNDATRRESARVGPPLGEGVRYKASALR